MDETNMIISDADEALQRQNSGEAAPTEEGSYHNHVLQAHEDNVAYWQDKYRDAVAHISRSDELVRKLKGQTADLEAQLRAASERAAANASNTEWVDRVAAEAADQLARQRDEYEAKLAEAKRIWEVADEERATARAQLKEVQANWKKYEPIDGVNCPRQAALRPQESADAEAIKQNPRIVE